MKSEERLIDLSDEISTLQTVKGALTVLREAGNNANEYHELFAYQMITSNVFQQYINELEEVVESLKKLDNSKTND